MKKVILNIACLGFVFSCGSVNKGQNINAHSSKKNIVRTTASTKPKPLQCFKVEYGNQSQKRTLKKFIFALYKSTTDQYDNFFQVKAVSNMPIFTNNKKASFTDFEGGGFCKMKYPAFSAETYLDCEFTDEGADGSLHYRVDSAGGKSTGYVSLTQAMNLNIIAEQPAEDSHVDPGYSASLVVQNNTNNFSYILAPYDLEDCHKELNFILFE